MRIGSLFAGVGGLELGLERAGLGEVAWQVEIDPWCRAVLARHWPRADRSVCDVTQAGAWNLEQVDIICGGFPCQDVSSAGLGAGLDGGRSGLWREYLRIVDECQPAAVVVENVASGKGRWLCQVRHDPQELGYGTRALGIGAEDVGAPHERRRIFVIALVNADSAGRARIGSGAPVDGEREARGDDPHRRGSAGREEVERRSSAQPEMGRDVDGVPAGLVRRAEVGGIGQPGPLRWPAGRAAEQHAWEPPRSVVSVSGTSRAWQLAALGNAVVPACAEVAGLVLAQWMGLAPTSDD